MNIRSMDFIRIKCYNLYKEIDKKKRETIA